MLIPILQQILDKTIWNQNYKNILQFIGEELKPKHQFCNIYRIDNKKIFGTSKNFLVSLKMKNLAYILLFVICFLFLHSEATLFSYTCDYHSSHDFCSIFEKANDVRKPLINFSSINFDHKIAKDFSKFLFSPTIPTATYNIVPKIYNHRRLYQDKLLQFIMTLLI